MTTVADVARWMEGFAPTRLAEGWDNVGLLLGDPGASVDRLMTCLTVTRDTAVEAIAEGANLIVSHHPVWFKPVQTLRADGPDGFLWGLARAGVSIYSPHTAFDNAKGGINDFLCETLGLVDVGPLKPPMMREVHKIVVFAPSDDRDRVLSAAFGAGAGVIGGYDECSFTLEGRGTFRGGPGTRPAIGSPGNREVVIEHRIELICRPECLGAALSAIRSAHSYEEPAIDVNPVRVRDDAPGVGRIGRLEPSTTLAELARKVADLLPAPGLQYAGSPDRVVERLAVACGGADDFVGDAAGAGSDAFLTGEARYHRVLEAESRGIGLLVAGHHATEHPAVAMLAGRLGRAFPELHAWPSHREADPLRLP